ncbi:VTT domain-containing protein [Muriicola marianensis]|uniref:Membrane protein n=1 Tax=Muriicola marianensis TaxID=1324801 RepID=A0ABQ1R812_9FLAO|nr:VTT domain-containing protein [Muriicola marianensis]GGD57991.1 membrane protein [Muriicola marianensis]
MELFELISNTDDFLIRQVESNLLLTYFILFSIIFSESGIIFCPFLPGDGLLFSVGVVAAVTPLNIYIVVPCLISAAILGYLFNYKMGTLFGRWAFKKENRFLRRSLERTDEFMLKYGSRAVIISRFFPVVRTYIPFFAGAVKMDYQLFTRQSIMGAVLWVCLFTFTGFITGEIPWVKENYGLIFLGLVLVTLLPLLYQLFLRILRFVK